MTSQIESNEVIDRLVEADPTLSQFLNDDFQSEEYAMKIVTSEVVSDVLDSLNKDRFQNLQSRPSKIIFMICEEK